MKIFFIVTFFISASSLFSQPLKSTDLSLRYQNVIEFIYNANKKDFIPIDTIEFSGMISIDSVSVFIESHNGEHDKKLKVTEIRKAPGTNHDWYICKMNQEVYSFCISPDKKFFYQIGQNDQFAYELSNKSVDSLKLNMVDNSKSQSSEEIYTKVEKMPLFIGSSNQDESNKLLYKYIEKKVNDDKLGTRGTVFVSFVVNENGRTENIEVLKGINSKCDESSVKYVENMPIWTPGEQKGKKVKVRLNIAIMIK